jgi:hypothetical protein
MYGSGPKHYLAAPGALDPFRIRLAVGLRHDAVGLAFGAAFVIGDCHASHHTDRFGSAAIRGSLRDVHDLISTGP